MVKRRRLSPSPEGEEQYQVEVIKKARVTEDGDWEYYVKWGGYSSDENSWEPTVNMQGCSELLKRFWEDVGTDDEDYHPGDTVYATPDWIERERHRYGHPPSKKKKTKDREPEKEKDTDKGKGKEVVASTSSPSMGRKVGKAIKQKSKNKKPTWVYQTESSDDDVPLANSAKRTIIKRLGTIEITSSDEEEPLSKARTATSNVSQSSPKIPSSSNAPAPKRAPDKPKEPAEAAQRKASRPDILKSGSKSNVNASTSGDHDSLFSAPSSPGGSPDPPKPPKRAPNLSIRIPPPTGASATDKSASSNTTTPVTASATTPRLPSHRERQANPKVQMMPMQLVDKSGTTSISTKQKLAERAGANKASPAIPPTPVSASTSKASPAVPLTPASATTSAPLPGRKSLANLSFKKNTPATYSNLSQPVRPYSTDAVPLWATDKTQKSNRSFFSDKPIVDSPVVDDGGWGDTDWNWPSATTPGEGWGESSSRRASGAHSPSILKDTAPITRRQTPAIPRSNTVQQSPKELTDAEKFLSSVMPPDMAAPMIEPTGDEETQPTSKPPAVAKKTFEFKLTIPKKWKWTGELYMEAGPDRADRLCNVALSDPTDPLPRGLRLSVVYNPDVSMLRLQKFHDISDLYILLQACSTVQQCCKVSHAAEEDFDAISTVGGWMARTQQFTYAHAYLDNDPVGLMILFPSAVTEVCTLFNVPSYLKDQSSILAALVPWKITVDEYTQNRWQQSQSDISDAGKLDPQLVKAIEDNGESEKLLRKPLFSLGLRIHRFTAEVYDFLTRTPHRPYCIWHAPVDGTSDEPGYETSALVAVLDECGAKNVGYKADVRILFVHVGALPTLHKLPALGMRRLKHYDMHIYSYGTHPSVAPERWGLREIYPCGGIMSVTPAAVRERRFDVYDLIKLVDEHPLWMCYIHPYVIGALVKLTYPTTDPSTLGESADFAFSDLLDLIEDGVVSLLYSPPLIRAPRLEKNRIDIMYDPQLDWIDTTTRLQFSGRNSMVEECVRMFETAFPKVPDSDIIDVVVKELMADMTKIALQHDIMDHYRRYVIIVESFDESRLEADGLELVTPSRFTFRDEYFDNHS